MCKMAVLGRGSMRDRRKEEELRASGDSRYAHLYEDLHVEISTFAAPAEAHARIAYALAEVRRFLVPVSLKEYPNPSPKPFAGSALSQLCAVLATLLANWLCGYFRCCKLLKWPRRRRLLKVAPEAGAGQQAKE